MTALLLIDTQMNRVRRYAPRRLGGRPHMTDEVHIVQPQCWTLVEQLNALREGRPLQYVDFSPENSAA